MGFPKSESYGLPTNAKSLVGSVMASFCKINYSVPMVEAEVSSQRILINNAFCFPKYLFLAQLKKLWSAVPDTKVGDFSEIWGAQLLSCEKREQIRFKKKEQFKETNKQ